MYWKQQNKYTIRALEKLFNGEGLKQNISSTQIYQGC